MGKKTLFLTLAFTLCLSLVIPAFAAQTYVPSWLEQGVLLEDAASFATPFTPVEKNGKWGYANQLGGLAIAPQYDYALAFSEGLAAVSKDGKCGYIDASGKAVIALQYEDTASFSEGLAAVGQNGKFGFIDKTGKTVVALQYEAVSSFSNGLALVTQGGKCGYVDKTGKVIVTRSTTGATISPRRAWPWSTRMASGAM